MAKAGRGQTRRDSKRRVLRPGESIRADGRYQYKYHIDGKPHFVYSWKLEPTDKLPKGKKPCLSLRELEKQVNTDLDMLVNIVDGQMTVCELVDRYLKTKTGVRQSTKQGYVTVQRLLAKETFGKNEIVDAMGSINISGNIIPATWYKTITKENGKPYLLAIAILADIVYWYRPSEVRNQGTGHILG